MNIIDLEQPTGVIVHAGRSDGHQSGQTSWIELRRADHRHRACEAIERAENRDEFEQMLERAAASRSRRARP